MKELITIITPTYNRVNEIKHLFNSLSKQSNLNFIWIVIDDGSTDKTGDYIDSIVPISKFEIQYFYKKNEGKHTALNYAFNILKTKMFCVVDSDDKLVPDAIQTIIDYFTKYQSEDIHGFVFLKGYSVEKPTVDYYIEDELIGDYVKDIINKQRHGDRFEVFYSELLKKHRFPVYEGEKFIGEGYFWNTVSKSKKLVFINKVIYLCDYLADGLTKQGRKMRISNSMGGLTHALEYIGKDYSYKIRLKNMTLYHVYYFFAKKQGKNPIVIKNSFLKFFCYIPGFFLYLYWTKKFL